MPPIRPIPVVKVPGTLAKIDVQMHDVLIFPEPNQEVQRLRRMVDLDRCWPIKRGNQIHDGQGDHQK
jgi:hypothetical protein